MLEVSERAKVALEIADPEVRNRLQKAVTELGASSKPGPEDKMVVGTQDMWVSRITDTVRMVYFLRPDGVFVDDVLDRRRYGG